MILTVTLVLLIIALIFVILNATARGVLWPAVLCLIVVELIRILPPGK